MCVHICIIGDRKSLLISLRVSSPKSVLGRGEEDSYKLILFVSSPKFVAHLTSYISSPKWNIYADIGKVIYLSCFVVYL